MAAVTGAALLAVGLSAPAAPRALGQDARPGSPHLTAGAREPDLQTAAPPPLVIAVRSRQLPQVTALLDAGADLSAQDGTWSPLLLAAFLGDQPIVDLLVSRGAAPNATNERGMTPLMFAAGRGHVDVVRTLIPRGGSRNMTDVGGSTALMYAANNGQLAAVQALIEAGARVNVWNRNGHSALSYARLNGHSEVAAALRAAGALDKRPPPTRRSRPRRAS